MKHIGKALEKLSKKNKQLSTLGVRLMREVWLFSWKDLQQSPFFVIGTSQVGLRLLNLGESLLISQ